MPYMAEKIGTDWFLFFPGSINEKEQIYLHDNETILSAINRYKNNQGTEVIEEAIASKFLIGEYFPRIYRPCYPHQSGYGLWEPEPKISLEEQLNIFSIECEKIFRIIQPDEQNFETFGHEVANLLILICTEIETQFRGIFKFHLPRSSISVTQRYTTNDFIKLLKPMRLSEYEIKINNYPCLPYFTPFKNWYEDNPTKSLQWFDAYNSIKHDRWENLSRATISNMLEALVACAIIYHAQYGRLPKSYGRIDFRRTNKPKWSLEKNYIPPLKPGGYGPEKWKAIKYEF